MILSENITKLFLQGGKVVAKWTFTCKTYLIQMPAGAFVKADATDDRLFEFIWVQNYWKNTELTVGGYYNGSISQAKKHAHEEHIAYCQALYHIEKIEGERRDAALCEGG